MFIKGRLLPPNCQYTHEEVDDDLFDYPDDDRRDGIAVQTIHDGSLPQSLIPRSVYNQLASRYTDRLAEFNYTPLLWHVKHYIHSTSGAVIEYQALVDIDFCFYCDKTKKTIQTSLQVYVTDQTEYLVLGCDWLYKAFFNNDISVVLNASKAAFTNFIEIPAPSMSIRRNNIFMNSSKSTPKPTPPSASTTITAAASTTTTTTTTTAAETTIITTTTTKAGTFSTPIEQIGLLIEESNDNLSQRNDETEIVI